MSAKSPETQKHNITSWRNCRAHDIFISGSGYQCANCLAFAVHSWMIQHTKAEGQVSNG